MSASLEILREAVFQRFSLTTPWNVLSRRHNIPAISLRRACASVQLQEAQPQCPSDITFTTRPRGRPTKLNALDEQTIAEAVVYYAENNTPLSKNGLRDLVQEYVSLLTPERQQEINFSDNRPSIRWVSLFLKRNGLQLQHVQMIEDKRVQAVTPENLTKHIARVSAAMKRFNIKNPAHIFNTDQSGASFEKMKGRSLRKGVGAKGMRLVQKALTTRGRLDRVTIMPVVSADGRTYKPVIIFPGKLAHYRKVKNVTQTLHSVLPECYLFQRNPPGADSDIVYAWAQGFIEETKSLRANGQRLLMILDGYGAHIQYRTLKLFKDNDVVVLALPAHTSHVTQPLDVTVFNSYRSFLQEELHRAARQKDKLNAFDVAQCIYDSYSRSHTAPNIRSGFQKAGIWDPSLMGTNFEPLRLYMEKSLGKRVDVVSVNQLLESFGRQGRTLLRDCAVDETGHVRVDTSSGLHVTSQSVLDALEVRRENRQNSKRTRVVDDDSAAYKEPAADIRRLIALAPARAAKRQRLVATRRRRRELRKSRTASAREDEVELRDERDA